MSDRLAHESGFTRDPRIVELLTPYEKGEPSGGLVHYEKVPFEVMRQIAAILPEDELQDAQNSAPTFAEMLEIGEKVPEIQYHGYRIEPSRSDERITIEGIQYSNLNLTDEQWELLVTSLRCADDFTIRRSEGYVWYD